MPRTAGRWLAQERAALIEAPEPQPPASDAPEATHEPARGRLIERLDMDSLAAVAMVLRCTVADVVGRYASRRAT